MQSWTVLWQHYQWIQVCDFTTFLWRLNELLVRITEHKISCQTLHAVDQAYALYWCGILYMFDYFDLNIAFGTMVLAAFYRLSDFVFIFLFCCCLVKNVNCRHWLSLKRYHSLISIQSLIAITANCSVGDDAQFV